MIWVYVCGQSLLSQYLNFKHSKNYLEISLLQMYVTNILKNSISMFEITCQIKNNLEMTGKILLYDSL